MSASNLNVSRESEEPGKHDGRSSAETALLSSASGSYVSHEKSNQETTALIPPESVTLGLTEILEQSEKYDDSPQDAKEWLLSFESLKQGTNVSLKLEEPLPKGSNAGPGLNATPRKLSLLPVLARWLRSWHERALNARRAQREDARRRGHTAVLHTLQEQRDLDWLSQYTRDYLCLAHPGYSDEDFTALSESLIGICHTTSLLQDVETAVGILHTLLSTWSLPQDLLLPVTKVLCQVRTLFSDSNCEQVVGCLSVLLRGEHAKRVLAILHAQARSDVSGSKRDRIPNLRAARGSLNLLRDVIDVQSPDGCFVIEFDSTSSLLHEVARGRDRKICIVILPLCGVLIGQGERLQDSLKHDWTTLTGVLRICAKPLSENVYDHDDGSANSEGSTGSSDFQKDVRHHQKAVEDINQTLSHLLAELSAMKGHLVYDYLLTYPSYLTTQQCLLVLQYAKDQHLCSPQDSRWKAECIRLLSIFVINNERTPEIRSRAIEAIGSVLTHPFFDSGDVQVAELEADAEAVTSVVKSLIQQLSIEQDLQVISSLTDALENANLSKEHTTQIIRHFQLLLTEKAMAQDDSDLLAGVAIQGLIRVFINSLSKLPVNANTAFQALVEASKMPGASAKARISAIRLLFGLRCDIRGVIHIQGDLESEYIATALCRTNESAESFESDLYEIPKSRHSASNASLARSSDSQENLWTYPELGPPLKQSTRLATRFVARGHPLKLRDVELDTGLWLTSLIHILQSEKNWEVYSFVIVHLGAQLSNLDLFVGSLPTIIKLRQVLCEQVRNSSFLYPPKSTELKASDVAICIFNVLTPLIAYATLKSEIVEKAFGDDLVRTFLSGVGGVFEGTARGCIHALSICALEVPASVASQYPTIIDKLSKNMTQQHLTMDILEFLSQVARLPKLHSNFRDEEITMIFGICIQFLERMREQNNSQATTLPPKLGTPSRSTHIGKPKPPYRKAMTQHVPVPHYASVLAYHTMIFWFLSLKLEIRANYVSWIVPRLVWKNLQGEETLDEQSQVFIDMMQRSAFSDLGETEEDPDFAKSDDGNINSDSWIVGVSVVTADTAGHTGRTQITKRQASGTTFAVYRQSTAKLPPHHAPSNTEIRFDDERATSTEMLPSHILLQMVATAAPTSVVDQPVKLPNEDFVVRSLAVFDRIPTIDSHKFGVLYIGESQTTEAEYLANTTGSRDYQEFIDNMGHAVSLEPPLCFNPQGLESPRDGTTTIAWRDRITELVYLIPTMMPTDVHDDPYCTAKKMHVGNCHVNIIFNRSGMLWKFENFQSQLNYINIVITPASGPSSSQKPDILHEDPSNDPEENPTFYKVQLLTRPDIPQISSAADPKIISASQLAPFVRIVALNADVFCQAWNAKETGDSEYPSSWRSRLQEIKRLKERVVAWRAANVKVGMDIPGANPAADKSRTRTRRDAKREESVLAGQLDFGKWALG